MKKEKINKEQIEWRNNNILSKLDKNVINSFDKNDIEIINAFTSAFFDIKNGI